MLCWSAFDRQSHTQVGSLAHCAFAWDAIIQIREEKQNALTASHLHDQQGRDGCFPHALQTRHRPASRAPCIPIVGTWVNRPQNEFIWVRNYKDKADLEAKGKAFQAEVAKSGIKLGTTVAKMEVREIESAFG